jgi:hypothetical protein
VQVTAAVRAQLAETGTQAIITAGGTGVTSLDDTYETVTALMSALERLPLRARWLCFPGRSPAPET